MQPKNRNIRQTASILLIIGVVATWLSASQPSVNSFPKTTPSHQSCGRFSVTKLYISTDFYRQNSGCRLQGEATELSGVSSAVHSFNPSSFWSLWSSKAPFYRWTSWRQSNSGTNWLDVIPPRDKYGKTCKILYISVITMALWVFLAIAECQRPTGTRWTRQIRSNCLPF